MSNEYQMDINFIKRNHSKDCLKYGSIYYQSKSEL